MTKENLTFLKRLLRGRKVPAPGRITKAHLDALAYAIKKGLESMEISIVGGYVKRFDNIQDLIGVTKTLISRSQNAIIDRIATMHRELTNLWCSSRLTEAQQKKVHESPSAQ